MIVIFRIALWWIYLENCEENCQLREKCMKTTFKNAILQYFSRWIQWNTLENSIPNISRRILKIHHFRPHMLGWKNVGQHQNISRVSYKIHVIILWECKSTVRFSQNLILMLPESYLIKFLQKIVLGWKEIYVKIKILPEIHVKFT